MCMGPGGRRSVLYRVFLLTGASLVLGHFIIFYFTNLQGQFECTQRTALTKIREGGHLKKTISPWLSKTLWRARKHPMHTVHISIEGKVWDIGGKVEGIFGQKKGQIEDISRKQLEGSIKLKSENPELLTNISWSQWSFFKLYEIAITSWR